jgi:hypothetical protein
MNKFVLKWVGSGCLMMEVDDHYSPDNEMDDLDYGMEYTDPDPTGDGYTVGTTRELSARQEFNLCPLCWMPLYIFKKNLEDANWCSVQYAFKGKPAFSIKASGSKRERPILVFGLSELEKQRKDLIVSCEDCHYIHSSTNAMSEAIGSWDKVEAEKKIQPINRIGNDNFLDFYKNLNITGGLWSGGVFEFLPVIQDGTTMIDRMEYFRLNEVFKFMSKKFAGCPDCNSKMTINKYIPFLFKLLIPPENMRLLVPELPARGDPGAARARGGARGGGRGRGGARGGGPNPIRARKNYVGTFDPETQMYYVILSGMIDNATSVLRRDAANLNWVYSIPDADHRETWSYRFLILWCLLQVLFSLWEDSTIKKPFRHHVSYIYSGIQDFYLSLLFYCMHCARFSARTNQVSGAVKFEIFNFYYSSHLPFFMISMGVDKGRNLSECVFGKDVSKFEFAPGITSAVVRTQFTYMKEKVLAFWREHFQHLSDFIINPEDLSAGDYRAYFCKPDKAVSIRDGCIGRELSIKGFREYFAGRPGYWFHFKHITMMKIEKECEKYHNIQGVALAQRVWDEWYNYLCQHIALLDVGPVRSRMHLSAVLREMGGGGRWRMEV